MGCRLVIPTSVTLNDLTGVIALILLISPNSIINRPIMSVEYPFLLLAKFDPCSSRVSSLCDS